jgi:outer membrane biosynthesis protein TonB
MGASKQPSKGSKNQGVVIALFVALFIIGGGAAYLILTHMSGARQDENKPGKTQKEEKVIESKSLVETPPPLPEDTPTLPVIDAESDAKAPQQNSSGKKYGGGMGGTIDPKVATGFIKDRTNRVRACYEKELKVNNLLMGVVRTQIIINPDGTVANVNFMSDTVGSADMKKCIKKEISSWKFPKPEGGRAEVQFPFRFEPKQK